MKNKNFFLRPSILPLFTLIVGAVGFILRFLFLRTKVGSLLPVNHPLEIALYILTACTLAALAICVIPLKLLPRRHRRIFRKTFYAPMGCTAAAIGILITGMQQLLKEQNGLNAILMVLAFVAAICFGFLAFARQKGSRPHYMVHAGIIVYLMLNLVCQYRVWSPEPQLGLYFFPLMACVCLMFSAYQALCLDLQKEDRRAYAFFNQAALFFCMVSLAGAQRYFYLGMGIYCATNLCTMRVSHAYYSSKKSETTEVTETAESGEED